jgi:ABC-type multidrug transport system fused ATPase/permease subunit
VNKTIIKIKNSKLLTLWLHLSRRRQKQFYLTLILMLIASIGEVVSIGAILPFIGVLTAPELIFQHNLVQPFIQYYKLISPNQLMLPFTIAFILASLFAGAVRLTLLYVTTRLSVAAGADLSYDIYRRTLFQDYSIHLSRNSSQIINGIVTKSNAVIEGILTPVLVLISSAFMFMGIMFALFAINFFVALTALASFGLLYWSIIRLTKHQIAINSKCIANESTQIIKSLQEGLGGIRDVLIDGSQQFYCQLYRNADLPLRRATGNNVFIGGSPRYAIEAMGMVMIAILAYFMSKQENGLASTIPVLGALALGAQRLLPTIQQAYSAYIHFKSSKSSFEDVLSLMAQPLPSYANQPTPIPIPFEKVVQLKKIYFRYSVDSPWVLKNINLDLIKGERIGFVGATGLGKSTLLDIIMGLLQPTSGEMYIDDEHMTRKHIRAWQAHIAHVPQNIFLSDSTIEENIAFGIPKEKINRQQIESASNRAQIKELIEESREGYNTLIGERGVRLSGGQRQRIGIARALYKQANILIFDEATSSLDSKTEEAVMDSIEGLGRDLTIFIIAHRLTTLKGCDKIIKLNKDNTISIGSYQNIINESKQ